LIAPLATTLLFLQFQKKQVKKELKRKIIAGIDKSELVLLKFTEEESLNQIKWEHSKEFEYKGEMYDVVEKEVHGDVIYYWCWWDHEETKLNKQLITLVDHFLGNNPTKQEKQGKLLDYFKKLYFESDEPSNSFLAINDIPLMVYSIEFPLIHQSPPTPPPPAF
jgi:hypothetical protein